MFKAQPSQECSRYQKRESAEQANRNQDTYIHCEIDNSNLSLVGICFNAAALVHTQHTMQCSFICLTYILSMMENSQFSIVTMHFHPFFF